MRNYYHDAVGDATTTPHGKGARKMTTDTIKLLEALRKKIIALSAFSFALFCAAIVVLIFVSDVSLTATAVICAVLLAVFIVAMAFISRVRRVFRTVYRVRLMRELYREVFDEFSSEPGDGIDRETVENTGMIMMGNTYSSVRRFRAEYKDVSLSLSEVSIKQISGDGKRNSFMTMFSGYWIEARFGRRFACPMQIRERSFNSNPRTGELFSKGRIAVRIFADNEEFDHIFKAYASPEDDAQRLLDSGLCSAVIKFNREVKGDFMFGFSDDTLHIACHGKRDVFEPKLFEAPDKELIKSTALHDACALVEFIDSLENIDGLFASPQ